jgi:hypothetical protein
MKEVSMKIRIVISLCLLVSFLSSGFTEEKMNMVPVMKGLSSFTVNGGHCLLSNGTHQFLAFYDGDHQITVAKRELGSMDWDFVKLPERVGWDSHNRIVIFFDRDGQLHLTGNMHNVPLKYYRTKNPGDIHSFMPIHTWAGHYEKRVTYPSLLKLRDGSCHMMYRHGGSGNGMRLLVHYDEKTQTWSGSGEGFINGMNQTPPCNAYPLGGIVEDNQGVLHIAWCWRETPDVLTNFDICYAKSDDGGATWKNWNGQLFTLPMTPDNVEVVESIPQNHGLINGGSLCVDQDGNPYIGYTRFDENQHNQMFVATPDRGQWKVRQITNWDQTFHFSGRGSIPAYPPIPRVSVNPDGTIQVAYSFSMVEPRQGSFTCTRDELLTHSPGEFAVQEAKSARQGIANVRATCVGPLPRGEQHYMVQKTAPANRDRKPENPMEPQMIYIYEIQP